MEKPVGKEGLLQNREFVYPKELDSLKEIREITAKLPLAVMATAPDAGQLIAMLLKLINAKKTVEIGIYTGYSLLLTALSIPGDGKILAIDVNRESYEIGLPIIEKAGVEHKIYFTESEALPVLDQLLEHGNAGSFNFAFIDADKANYKNYHERMMKVLKVGGMAVYDITLWGGIVAMVEGHVAPAYASADKRDGIVELNNFLATDNRIEISHVPLGDGITICKRIAKFS